MLIKLFLFTRSVGVSTVKAFKCDRCQYVWCPRNKDEKPLTCPRCRSAFWDTPRRRKQK